MTDSPATATPPADATVVTPPRTANQEQAERRLVLLMCGAAARRQARAEEAAALLEAVDGDRLTALLRRLRLLPLVGGRLLELGDGLDPRLEQEILEATVRAREQAKLQEMTTLTVLAGLERAGIRALALKGSVLARALYGDVAARSSGDIDVLVAASDLRAAVEVVRSMDWHYDEAAHGANGLPTLHEVLTHPILPRVELHWRVHWYEEGFAGDALARAERPGPHQPLMMTPEDGLAALIQFYARDGFSGLRMAADVATWWDTQWKGGDLDAFIRSQADRYPELAGALFVGTELLGALVGLPTSLRAEPAPWRVAAQLATPFREVNFSEVRAKASLIDLLLAPPQGRGEALRRELRKVPADHNRRLTGDDALSLHAARWGHVLRTGRHWALAFAPAAVRAGRRAGRNDAGAATP